jgi:NAD-dependent dihydropyrimidine dehydrogenase PreA subunit
LPADCGEVAGRVAPVVDRNRCDGKAQCVEVCPFDVFQLAALTAVQRRELSLLARLKARVLGGRQAFVVRPLDCHACGLCVRACPERALKLVPREMPAAERPA